MKVSRSQSHQIAPPLRVFGGFAVMQRLMLRPPQGGYQVAVLRGFERCEDTDSAAIGSRRIKLHRTESFRASSPPMARERVH